jgi:iron complex outermembrane recepter protein
MKKYIYFYISLFALMLLQLNASAQKVYNLNQVTIKADSIKHLKNDSVILNSPENIGSVTQKDFDRNSGLSLQNTLNLIPGVEMQNREPWGGDRFIIRGYIPNLGSPANLSVNTGSGYGYMAYIDGIPITDATGNTIMDDIDNSTIGSAQVIKGPASALYGSYTAGSINLFTPTVAPGTTSVQEQAIGGSYGLFRNNLTLETATNNSSIWINYGDQTYNGFRTNDGAKDQFLQFAGTFKTNDKNTITTFLSYDYSNDGLSGELDSDQVYGRQAVGDTNYDANDSHVLTESYRAGITDNYQFDKYLSDQLTLFGSSRDINQVIAHGYTDYYEGDFGGRDAFTFRDGIVTGILGGSFQKFNEALNGFSIAHSILSPFTATTPGTPSDQQNYALNYNIFTQWSIKLPAHFILTAGASENFSEYGLQNMLNSSHTVYNNPGILIGTPASAFTPSASLTKVFSKDISVYANVGTGYTPVGLSNIENSNNQAVTGLKPETAIQYELGTKGTLLNSNLTYQLALYDLDVTNRFIQEYSDGIGQYTNAGEQRDMGVELYVGYNIIKNKKGFINLLTPWISYTYDDAEYVSFETYAKSGNTETVMGDYTGNKAVGVAPNMANAGVDLGTKAGFYLHITYQYMDKVPFTFDNEHYMNSYSLLNGKLGWAHQFGHLSLDVSVGVDNALSQTYYTSVFFADDIKDLAQYNDLNYYPAGTARGTGGDGYILPAPYNATFYGGVKVAYTF